MGLFRLVVAVALLVLPVGAAFGRPLKAAVEGAEALPGAAETGSVDELKVRYAIIDSVNAAVAARDFAGLNATAAQFRTSRARTPSGTWKLAMMHSALHGALSSKSADGLCHYDAPFVKEWAAFDPAQPGPYVTEAALLLSHGWCYRGTGFADTVSEESWKKFRSFTDAAYRTLSEHDAVAKTDPAFYAVMVNIYRAQGADKDAFQRLIDEAAAREPYYYETYFNAVYYYMPQWGGSYGEIDALARFAAEKTRKEDGMGTYARVYWYLESCGCDIEGWKLDIATMDQAMKDVMARYPVDWNAANFARLSCTTGDYEQMAIYFGKLTDEVKQAWPSEIERQACLAIALRTKPGRN